MNRILKEPQNQWLHWAREIQALAQASYHYAQNEFERARAERMIEIAADITARHCELTTTEVMLAFRAQTGYVTPKVDVRAAVFRADEILLVQEAMDGGWTLPGGWADVGESPRTAIEREVREETGYIVSARDLVGVYDANRIEGAYSLFHAYKLLFICELEGGDATPSIETTAVGFFPLDQLPEPFSPHRTTGVHLADAISAHRRPDLPAVFD
jgi:ADP-ribose pyrophosphatase YjhB (NUDIX family)